MVLSPFTEAFYTYAQLSLTSGQGGYVRNYKHALPTAKTAYLPHLISDNKHSPVFITETAAKLTRSKSLLSPPSS